MIENIPLQIGSNRGPINCTVWNKVYLFHITDQEIYEEREWKDKINLKETIIKILILDTGEYNIICNFVKTLLIKYVIRWVK